MEFYLINRDLSTKIYHEASFSIFSLCVFAPIDRVKIILQTEKYQN